MAEYGFMSIKGQMTMAALSQASFGLTLAAIDVERVQRLASYFISSMSSGELAQSIPAFMLNLQHCIASSSFSIQIR